MQYLCSGAMSSKKNREVKDKKKLNFDRSLIFQSIAVHVSLLDRPEQPIS